LDAAKAARYFLVICLGQSQLLSKNPDSSYPSIHHSISPRDDQHENLVQHSLPYTPDIVHNQRLGESLLRLASTNSKDNQWVKAQTPFIPRKIRNHPGLQIGPPGF